MSLSVGSCICLCSLGVLYLGFCFFSGLPAYVFKGCGDELSGLVVSLLEFWEPLLLASVWPVLKPESGLM